MKVNSPAKNQPIQTQSDINHCEAKEPNKQDAVTSRSSHFMWMPGQEGGAPFAPGDVSASSMTTNISKKIQEQYQGFEEAHTASIMPAFDPIIFESILNAQSEAIKCHLFLTESQFNPTQLPLKPVFFPVEDTKLVENFLNGKNFGNQRSFDSQINKMVGGDGYDGATLTATISSVTADINDKYLNIKKDKEAIAMLLARACFIPLPPNDELHANFISQTFPKLKSLEIDIHGLPGNKMGFADNERLKNFDGQISASDIVRQLNVFKPNQNHRLIVAACYAGDETPASVPLQSRLGNPRENTLSAAIADQLKREYPCAPSVVLANQGIRSVGLQRNDGSEDNWADIGEHYARFGQPELLASKITEHIMIDEIQPIRFSRPAADVTVYYPNSSNPHLHGNRLVSYVPQRPRTFSNQSEVITRSMDIQTDAPLNATDGSVENIPSLDSMQAHQCDQSVDPMIEVNALPISLPNLSYLRHLDPMPILKVTDGQSRETQIELNDLPALSLIDSMKFRLGSDREWESKWAPSDENLVSRSIGTSTSENSKLEKFTQTTYGPEYERKEIGSMIVDAYPNKSRFDDIRTVPTEIRRGVNSGEVGVNQGVQAIENGILPFGVISNQIQPYPLNRPDWYGQETAGADARYTVPSERQKEMDAWDEERARRLSMNSRK